MIAKSILKFHISICQYHGMLFKVINGNMIEKKVNLLPFMATLESFFFFRLKTMHKMMERSGTLFRDPEDVEQATRFLHENGKILSLHKNCIHLHHVFFMGKLFILNFWGEIFVNTLYLELLNSSKCNLVHHVLEILI